MSKVENCYEKIKPDCIPCLLLAELGRFRPREAIFKGSDDILGWLILIDLVEEAIMLLIPNDANVD